MKKENEKMIKDNERNNQENEELIRHYSIEGLPQHNRSLRWLLQHGTSMGARFNPYSDCMYNKYGNTFEVEFEGKRTGIKYKLGVTLRTKVADLLSAKISQVDLTSPGAAMAIEPIMSRLLQVQGSWWDVVHREWNSFCVGDDNSDPGDDLGHRLIWPADRVLTLIITLQDDFRTSLDDEQYSLRNQMKKALPIYWFADRTPEGTSFQQLATMMSLLTTLSCSTATSHAVKDLALGMLVDPEPDYPGIIEELGRVGREQKAAEDLDRKTLPQLTEFPPCFCGRNALEEE